MPKEEETLEVGKDSESVQVNEEEEEENEEERLSGDEQSRNEKEVTEPEANEETSVQQEEEKSKSENYEEEVKDETDDYLYEQAEAKIHFPDITEPTVSSTTTQEVVYEPEVRLTILSYFFTCYCRFCAYILAKTARSVRASYTRYWSYSTIRFNESSRFLYERNGRISTRYGDAEEYKTF